MSISLQKGQKVSLTKEGREGLNRVVVGLGWDEAKKKGGLLGGLFSGGPTRPSTATLPPLCCGAESCWTGTTLSISAT